MRLRFPGGIEAEGESCEIADLLLRLRAQGVTLAQMDGQIGLPVQGCAEVAPAQTPAAVSIDEAVARWKDVLGGEGKSVRTIQMYADRVGKAASAAGWTTVNHVNYETALAWLSARQRNDHHGRPWGNGAVRQAMSCLRSFGRFLELSGLTARNPLAAVKLPKRGPQRHKHPFSADEARRLIVASIARAARDKRASPYAPLAWATLFWTGLRHSEIQPACRANAYGGLKWRDLVLEGEHPGIWTDPRWIGNKSKKRDWIPLYPRLVELLLQHRERVPHNPGDPVFPEHPNRATWIDDRVQAGLPAHDADGRTLSVHSTRASYCTWVGALTLPEGLRDRLTRHDLGVAESVYTVRDRGEMAAAIAQLPDIRPDFAQSTTEISSSLTPPNADGNLSPARHHDLHTHKTTRAHAAQVSGDSQGQRSRVHAEGREGPLGSPQSGTETLIPVLEDRRLDAVIAVLTDWASRRLSRHSHKGVASDETNTDQR